MVCLDRDRGAISCCSGGARLPRGLATGTGTGDRRRRGRERSEEPRARPWGGFVTAEALGCCGHQTLLLKLAQVVGARCPWVRSRALACGSSWHRDGDHETSCLSPMLLDWACKELKKNIYMCGFFGQGSESTRFPPPPLPRNYPTYSERQHLCRTVCVCLVRVESCPYKLCSVDFRFRCVSGVFFLSSCKHGRLWCWGVA